MTNEKCLNPCTINIRLRTLKCYIKWLFDEGYIDFNYSMKLKLVKTPEDTIKPLSDVLKELIRIAQDNNSDYIFQSTYGGKLGKNVVIANF